MNSEIVIAKKNINRLKELEEELKKLREEYDYIPKDYSVIALDKISKELSERLSNLETRLVTSEKKEMLDELVALKEKLILQQENFDKYRKLNKEKEDLLLSVSLSVNKSVETCYEEIFSDVLNHSSNIENFLNDKCLASPKIKVPFMVALLTHSSDEIYFEVTKIAPNLSDNAKQNVKKYIEIYHNKIKNNLVLSDTALVNLLETNTGRNIMAQTRINDKSSSIKDKYRRLANGLCHKIFKIGSLTTVLTTHSAKEVINLIKIKQKDGGLQEFNSLGLSERDGLFNHINYTEANLQKEIEKEMLDKNIAVSTNYKKNKYDIISGNPFSYSFDNTPIRRFNDNSGFVRTINDLQISNFSTANIEEFIGKSFASSKVPRDTKKEMVAAILDNLELCYDMFKSYYMSKNEPMSSYMILTNDLKNLIRLNQPLNDTNIPHLLGIPSSRNRNTRALNLPIETLKFLELNPDEYYSAKKVLESILLHKDDIIEKCVCGCIRGKDGTLYEMLPWEKIILKTNAFIRGDFFKSTSIIAVLNSKSYMTKPNEEINAVAINSTSFASSMPLQTNWNSDYELSAENLYDLALDNRKADLILKGLITELKSEAQTYSACPKGRGNGQRYAPTISRINGVVTNESFIGERLKDQHGMPIRTLNKARNLLEILNAESGGATFAIKNENGNLSYKSLEANIALLENLIFSFSDVKQVIELSERIINQLNNIYGLSKKYTNDMGDDTLRLKRH